MKVKGVMAQRCAEVAALAAFVETLVPTRCNHYATDAHSEVFPFLEPRNAPNVQVVVRWVMSNRAIQFLNDWVNEHVKPIPYPAHLAEARRLAKECVADAKKQGISKKELEEDLGQGLVSELKDALDTRADEEVKRMANGNDEDR